MTRAMSTQEVMYERRLVSLPTLIFAINTAASLNDLSLRWGFISVPAYAFEGSLTHTCLKTGETLFNETWVVLHRV